MTATIDILKAAATEAQTCLDAFSDHLLQAQTHVRDCEVALTESHAMLQVAQLRHSNAIRFRDEAVALWEAAKPKPVELELRTPPQQPRPRRTPQTSKDIEVGEGTRDVCIEILLQLPDPFTLDDPGVLSWLQERLPGITSTSQLEKTAAYANLRFQEETGNKDVVCIRWTRRKGNIDRHGSVVRADVLRSYHRLFPALVDDYLNGRSETFEHLLSLYNGNVVALTNEIDGIAAARGYIKVAGAYGNSQFRVNPFHGHLDVDNAPTRR